MSKIPIISPDVARRFLMHGQGLLGDPARRASPAATRALVEQMGFVQVDTINVVERAHHHILQSRLDGYRPAMLAKLLERDRALFEHWTHDASVIPTRWLRYWTVRFARYRARDHARSAWWAERMGDDPEGVLAHVLERIEREGPLRSRDFEHPEGGNGPWWGWKPQKVALEFAWRSGTLAIARRDGFHKVYDLAARVYPDAATDDAPDHDEHVDWACGAALERLGVATPSELAQFFRAVDLADARAWCADALARGDVEKVLVESADDSRPRPAFALPDWRSRAKRLRDAPDRMRLLSPFDPILRDRARALRYWGFDYRFEAFVPEPKRRYGYYVLPILDGERLVGRLDPKLHRDRRHLEVKGLWWEPGVTATRARTARLRSALDRFAHAIGADDWSLPKRAR